MSTIKHPRTLLEAVRYFADPQVCQDFVVALRWPDGIKCPRCGAGEVFYLSKARRWKCRVPHPSQKFSVKVGTIMEDSPIGLDKWLPAMWLIASCKNGVSSYEIARALKITQKSAWFMMHRIRLAMQESGGVLGGPGAVVELDETWIGGKARSMNKGRRGKVAKETAEGGAKKRGPYAITGKAIVMGMLERGGRVKLHVVPDVKGKTLRPLVRKHVAKGSELHTDELQSYTQLDQPEPDPMREHTFGDYPVDYIHEAVNHAADEYVRGNVHVNGIENFWSLLKRGLRGTYISVEPFHLFRYVDEQAFRFNTRKQPDGSRFLDVVRMIVGKRLTYQKLIGGDSLLAPA